MLLPICLATQLLYYTTCSNVDLCLYVILFLSLGEDEVIVISMFDIPYEVVVNGVTTTYQSPAVIFTAKALLMNATMMAPETPLQLGIGVKKCGHYT